MLKKGFLLRALLAGCMVLGLSVAAFAERPKGEPKERPSLAKGNAEKVRYQILNINNLWSWIRNDGQANHSPLGRDGVYYPRNTGHCVYQDGLMWGGKCYVDAGLTIPAPNSQLIRVGGANYAVGTREGWIIGSGASAVAADPNDVRTRSYRIRRDYFFMSDEELQRDADEYFELSLSGATASSDQVATIKRRYDDDWKEWPVDLGAPYIERNGTPGYQAPPAFSESFTPDNLITGNYDEPGVAGADPNSPADQVIWMVFNDLDANATVALQGSDPIGLECQVTMWGYKRTDALGNIYFKRYKLFNKGGVRIDAAGTKGSFYVDSMYVCQWSDIDLGNAGDDLIGCDVDLSMGFTYNANAQDDNYRQFQLPPPADGYDFLQGPIIASPGDSAVFDLKRIQGFKNLPMSSFSYFSAGSVYSDPPRNYSQGTIRWYKLMRGFVPLDGPDLYYPFPPGQTQTQFPYSGDPVTKTGFIDGLGTQYSFAPGDRRILVNTGPFRLNPGDVQEIVVALVVGLGSDRLSSISVMKFNDKFAQNTYNALFQVAKPPAKPNVVVSELDGEVILEWGSNQASVADIEGRINNPGAFRFEGYNVYQFPRRNSSISEATRIATFDLPDDPSVVLDEQFDPASGQILRLPVQYGSNSGITRQFHFRRDYVRDIDKIYNGQEYFLAVTAYSVSTVDGYTPTALESEPQLIIVTPKRPFGMQLQTALGDTVQGVVHSGPSDGAAYPVVVQPDKLTGHDYKVVFKDDGSGTGNTVWDLIDVTAGNKVVIADVANQTGDDQYLFTDGFQLRVVGAPLSFKRIWTVANAAGPLNPPGPGCFAFNNSGFPTSDGLPPNDAGTNDRPQPNQQANGAAGRGWGVHTADNGTRANFDPFLTRVSNTGANWPRIIPQDWEIRFTAAGGYAYDPFVTGKVIRVPFEIWRIGIGTPDNTSDDVRFVPYVLDDDESGTFNLCATHPNAGGSVANEHSISGGDNDPYTDWIYFATPADVTPGDAGYKAWEAAALAIPPEGDGGAFYNVLATDNTLRRIVLVNWNGGSVNDPTFPANVVSQMPETGTIFRLVTTKPNTPLDSFTFSTPAPVVTAAQQAASFNNIGVYPNPYYAFNPAEENSINHFVTFNNLPPTVTIRIFNLAGQLVRTLEKTNNSDQFMRWDLQNQTALPVASGMYIAYVEGVVPASGEKISKVVKFAVIQEQEILDVF